MGWWNAPDNSEVMVGDAVLDVVRHFLREFSSEYMEDLARKPSLQELQYVLNLAFRVNVDGEILSGFDEMEVKEVNVKAARRKKRRKPMPGDIFAYRLSGEKFGFGRIVAKVSIGAIAEVFDYFSSQPIFDHSAEKSWLTPPVPIASHYLFESENGGDWRIIESDPDFVAGEKFNSLRYVYGVPPNGLMAIDIFENDYPISVAEAEGLPEFSPFDDITFNELILQILTQKNESGSHL